MWVQTPLLVLEQFGRVDSGRQADLKSVAGKTVVGSNPSSSVKCRCGEIVDTRVLETRTRNSVRVRISPSVPL